jgi:hypothetical protein
MAQIVRKVAKCRKSFVDSENVDKKTSTAQIVDKHNVDNESVETAKMRN